MGNAGEGVVVKREEEISAQPAASDSHDPVAAPAAGPLAAPAFHRMPRAPFNRASGRGLPRVWLTAGAVAAAFGLPAAQSGERGSSRCRLEPAQLPTQVTVEVQGEGAAADGGSTGVWPHGRSFTATLSVSPSSAGSRCRQIELIHCSGLQQVGRVMLYIIIDVINC